MICHIHLPQTRLAEAIECLFINQADVFETRSLSVPLLNQELFFNMGDVFEVSNLRGSFTTRNMTSWLTGIHTTPMITQTAGRHVSVGVLFKPWGLYQAFGIHGQDIANSAVDSHLLFKGFSTSFVAEKASILSPSAFLAALENYLLAFYKPRKVKSHVIQLVEGLDASGFQKGKMRSLARELTISPKSFINAFNTSIGVSPVKYYHLRMVHRAMQQIRQHPGHSLTEIGLNAGFYDQAHFIRIFTSYSGISPKQYRKQSVAGVNFVQF